MKALLQDASYWYNDYNIMVNKIYKKVAHV